MRVLRPPRAAALASEAETVVLPTPPLPATMTRREAAKNCAGSNLDTPRREPIRRKLLRRLSTAAAGLTALVVLFGAVLGESPAGAAVSSARYVRTAQATGSDPGRVSVVKVSGLLDPITIDFVEGSIKAAERAGAVAIVLQLNSGG